MTETTRQPIGQLLDTQGLMASLNEGDLIDGAIVIMRVIDTQGRRNVRAAWTDAMDWITRRGLVEIMRDMDRVDPVTEDE